MKRTFAGRIFILSVLLALFFSAVGVAPAQACGFHTHAYIAQLATEILNDNFIEEYEDLVSILKTYPNWVDSGEVFPDWGMAGEKVMPDCGQVCLDAGEVAHNHIVTTNPNFQQTMAAQLVVAAQKNPDERSPLDNQSIAFLLGVIGHNLQDETFDNGVMAEDIRIDSNDTHEFIDLGVNAFTIKDLGGKADGPFLFPLNLITNTYTELGVSIPSEWLRDGTRWGLPLGYIAQEDASNAYYGLARYLNHTWLYGTPNVYQPYLDYNHGGLKDLANRTATTWMRTWDWLTEYTPITHANISPALPNGNNSWHRQYVTFSLMAGDNFDGKDGHIETGPFVIWYSVDSEEYQQYTGPFTISEEGVHQVFYYAVDAFGNSENPQSKIIKIDLTPPEINTWADQTQYTRTEPFTVHFTGSDAVSGLDSITGKFNGQPVIDEQNIDLFWLPLGTYTLNVRAEDMAGNVTEASQSIELVATLDGLKSTVERLCAEGYITKGDTCNELIKKLDAAIAANNKGNTKTAANILNAFQNAVNAQAGKSIQKNAADLLLMDSDYMIKELIH